MVLRSGEGARPGVPSDEDPVARAASEVVGGPLGRYARLTTRPLADGTVRRHLEAVPWRGPATVLVVAACLLVALGVAQKSFCFSSGWGGPGVFWHACYSDLPRLYVASPLADGAFPYAPGGSVAQPVGTGLVLWAISWFVPGGGDGPVWFTGLWALAAAGCACGLVVATAATTRRDPWRAAHIAFSPLLVTTALVAPDLAGVLLVSAGIWAWSKERPLAAGVLLGLATASRTYALVVLAAAGLVALRAGVLREWARTAGTALVTFAAVLGGAWLAGGDGVFGPYREWLTAPAEYGALWYLPTLAGSAMPLGALTALAIAGWLLALLVGALVALVPRRRPQLAEVALVMLVVVLLTSKAVPVQAALWVLPLVALAGARWRAHLVWAGAELLYFVAVWLYLGGQDDPRRALPASWYAFFLVLRLGALGFLAWATWRAAARRPAPPPLASRDRELVAAEDPDDAAGPAAGRRDRVVVTM